MPEREQAPSRRHPQHADVLKALAYIADQRVQEAVRAVLDAAGVDPMSDNGHAVKLPGRPIHRHRIFSYEAVKEVARASYLYDRMPMTQKLTDRSQIAEIRARAHRAAYRTQPEQPT